MNEKGAVEAALFSSPDGILISEIAERTGISETNVGFALMDLKREYDERDCAMVIFKSNNRYMMILRGEYTKYVSKFARAEMSGGVMRTLSTIAYNQPVLQSELFRTRGPRTYEDVPLLAEMGFVSRKKSGQTWELTTTQRFSEYFGIGSTKKADIKAWIESQSKNAEE